MAKRPRFRQHLTRGIDGHRVGLDRVQCRDGVRTARVAPGERLLEQLAGNHELDRVSGERPIGPRRLAVSQRLDATDVALLERQLDARADQCVAFARFARAGASLPLDARCAHEYAEPLRLVHHHGVRARSEVAAIDGDPAAGPHTVVALKADAVGDDDVRFLGRRVTGRPLSIFDGRPRCRVHLYGVADPLRRAPVLQVGSA